MACSFISFGSLLEYHLYMQTFTEQTKLLLPHPPCILFLVIIFFIGLITMWQWFAKCGLQITGVRWPWDSFRGSTRSKLFSYRGRSCGQVVKFACSASAAQGFASLDPGRGHGTAHQATLRQRPTCHNQRHPQLEYAAMYWGALGRRRRKKKKRLVTDVSAGAKL